MQFDYNYLCYGLGHLTGLETRVYKNDKLIEHYSPYPFEPDIAELIYPEIDKQDVNAFFIETEYLLIFGVIKSKKDQITLIIGPTLQIRPGRQETVAMLYMLDEPYKRLSDLESYFSNMTPYPFENFLEILCFVNYSLNAEKLTVSDLIAKKNVLHNKWPQEPVEQQPESHNTYEIEKLMLSYITAGNLNAVQSFIRNTPAGRIGTVAHSELRQRKNLFIISAALMSRAAIIGGMPSETAFALSDRYIQKAELLNIGRDITALNAEMLLDYTKRVEILKCGSNRSLLAMNIMRYVLKNISNKITLDELAKALNMNRSYLCKRFKSETGTTINDFIIFTKITEAKRMLLISDYSIAQISDYLSFSSQSYFQNIFKKIEGRTPRNYRIQVRSGKINAPFPPEIL